jgi:hypothetical protein
LALGSERAALTDSHRGERIRFKVSGNSPFQRLTRPRNPRAAVEVNMVAHRSQSRFDHRPTSDRMVERRAAPATGRFRRRVMTESMTVEGALKHALVGLTSAALSREIEVVCEILPGVGELVLGDRARFLNLVAGVVEPAMASARGGEVCVRLARQQAGFAPTDRVLVSVAVRRAGEIEDMESLEVVMPLVERDDEPGARVLDGARVLLVVPTQHLARLHGLAVRRFGARVEAVHDVQHAHDRMRAAAASGTPIHAVYLDDRALDVMQLLAQTRDDASLGMARSVVATALEAGPMRDAYAAAGAAATLSKPVLPLELRDSISALSPCAGPPASTRSGNS